MIAADRRYTLGVTTHACANGETVECRLVLWDEDGKAVTLVESWVDGGTTNLKSVTGSLFRLLGHR